MKNEELKKKICKIIAPYVSAWGEDERIADALIAAGIGDTSNLEVRCEVLQRDVGNLTRTVEEGAEELKEAEHRAEVAEKELLVYKEVAGAMLCEIDCSNEGYCPEFYKDPECKNCTKKKIYGNSAATFPCLFDKYIQQAKKELAEERKDGHETD